MFTLFVSPYVNLIIGTLIIWLFVSTVILPVYLSWSFWMASFEDRGCQASATPQPPHTSNLDLEVKVTGIWTCPRLLVSTPTVSTSKSYVTSFSSYYIHKLVCPHCPLTCRGDANTPSTFLQPRDKNRLTGHRFSLSCSYFSSAVAVSLHRNFLCSATRMKALLYNHNENRGTLPSDCNGIWIQFSVCIWKHLYAEYLQHTQTLPVCRDLLITDW